ETEDVADWGDEMLKLNRKYGMKILGGCCGTGVTHLKYLAEAKSG
ncbi:MAG: homocysteine S-methyltransferase family protein, partial [Planctomycetota bacterium]